MTDGSVSKPRATDFFERQDRARKNTVRLVSLLVLVVALLSAGTYVALGLTLDILFMLGGADPKLLIIPMFAGGDEPWFHPQLAGGSVLLTVGVIVTGGIIKTHSLRGGGPSVAEELGGTEVDSSVADPQIRRFVNVVEEMAIASGMPVPRMFVLEEEPGINAFAAGYTINDAAVAVTRGALRQLTRDELQGVVAHEFSHILNGDMRLNIRMIGLLHGILGIFLAGTTVVREAMPKDWGRRRTIGSRGDDGAGLFLVVPGLIVAAAGFAGVVCSRLIKSAVSRQREYLADAAAVQFTRNPEGLAEALKKIGGYTYGSGLRGARAEMVSHMCFGNVASRSRLTHPPLEERIVAIDPSFDPDMGYRKLDAETDRSGIDSDQIGSSKQQQSSALRDLGAGGEQLDADDVVASVGETSPERLVYCSSLLGEIPDVLLDARNSMLGAVTLVYLLLLDEEDDEERKKQAKVINEMGGDEVRSQAQKLWPVLKGLDPQLRLPLMDLLVPALRRMTAEQFEDFAAVAERLIEVDDKVSFREFILEKLVLHHLEMALGEVDKKAVQFRSFSGVTRDIENVLSALATAGTDDEVVMEGRFQQGREYLPKVVRGDIEWRPPERWTFEMVAASLKRLAAAAPRIKEAVIDACAHCVLADDQIMVEEVEMLRAVCETLDVPLPPFVPRHTRKNGQ